ncbi:hypothetical protein SAMN05444004_101564 [Jannaschia faecimaris]|uniref:Uncharacterized protein n=1 Tax=Jannaschia faecimaris TaxID=1244108 RepID=A0A1H3KBR9_9RHOB|nr:hypothetical protein SAMN05444004_101564 [Jannaschia faecimaris]
MCETCSDTGLIDEVRGFMPTFYRAIVCPVPHCVASRRFQLLAQPGQVPWSLTTDTSQLIPPGGYVPSSLSKQHTKIPYDPVSNIVSFLPVEDSQISARG